MNSKTLGLLFMANHQTSVPLREPEFIVISGLIHITIQFISQIIPIITQKVCGQSRIAQFGFHNFSHSGPKFWDRSNGRSRPQTNRNIHKTLKQSITSSRMRPLPHGICRNSLKLEHTCRPHCVERLSFLSRRIPTVGSPVILERSCTLSH